MITHFAEGGLGNQLFNYAAVRSLADRGQTNLILDLSSYVDQQGEFASRPFSLDQFPIRAKLRNVGKSTATVPLPKRLWRKLQEDWFCTEFVRPTGETGFAETFNKLGPRAILRGHFISRHYFEWNGDQIRRDLSLPLSVLNGNSSANILHRDIEATVDSVSVHVRRGDLLEPGNRWLLLERVEDYYKTALREAATFLSSPVYYVFSDDLEWCRQSFSGLPYDIRFVGSEAPGGRAALVDFLHMGACKHHIIANSAFSWWPAWLSRRAGHRIFCPYIFDNQQRVSVDDMYPASWTRVTW